MLRPIEFRQSIGFFPPFHYEKPPSSFQQMGNCSISLAAAGFAMMFLVSRLDTLEVPQQKLIVRGQPLFTMQMRLKTGDPMEKLEIVHAVRTFNGQYKIYRIDKPTVVNQ